MGNTVIHCVPWIKGIVAIAALSSIFVVAARLGRPFGHAVDPERRAAKHQPWLQDLVGQRVHIPDEGLAGERIPANAIRIVVSLPDCLSCSAKSINIAELAQLLGGSGLFVLPNSEAELPKWVRTLASRSHFVCEPRVRSIPVNMAVFAPQFGVFRGGKIVAVPGPNQSGVQFIQAEVH